MASVELVSNLKSLGRTPPEKTVNLETPKIQNSFEFPGLKEAENQHPNPPKKWQGNKRKKSEGSPPPGSQPYKKKGSKFPKPIEAAASILDNAIVEKIKIFTIPIFNRNKARNLGAYSLTINLPKNCTKQQKLSYQERFVNAVKDAKRWEDWSQKQAKRQEEEQRQKSVQYSQMLKKNLQQTENVDVMDITT